MKKIVFAINITTDGFCSHTDMIADDQLHKYFTDLLRKGSIMLYGRITYQLMVPFWPEVARDQSMSEISNEFARVFTSLDKILFSTTLKQTEETNTRLVSGNIIEEILQLKQQSGKDILVGSLSLATQLLEHDLIDEYRFVVHPVIAGKGPRLFDAVNLQQTLRLDFLGSETFQSGVIALHYKKRI
ncbi:dihydrofolate reductase family protein [Leptospira neocaledonica]|uniref:Dihydrofolate reductase n=1 Tax=Leptospira neocaledonica TaxID=2023192 RepID=A0A2M9ZWC5_9LEPT|nr:dihydrofolate reductase family protein [Leptospira neocaledonica]PJZ76330.1 dihydrofolate reductase [Leptospira neocaledonica]